MENNTYDLDTLLDLKPKEITKVQLGDSAIAKILDLKNNDCSGDIRIKATAHVESQDGFVTSDKKIKYNLVDADSPEIRIQKARRIFNSLNIKNCQKVSREMKILVKPPQISEILFHSIESLFGDQPQNSILWGNCIMLLNELSKDTKYNFKDTIINDTNNRYDKLLEIQKENIKKIDIENYQKFFCWISCLLNSRLITFTDYSNYLYKIIHKLDVPDVVTILLSSLSVSGKFIDDEKNLLDARQCWYLFTYLKLNASKCPSYSQYQVFDLFELRSCSWDKQKLERRLTENQNSQTPGKSPIIAKPVIKKDYNQIEYWEKEFSEKFKYQKTNYQPPKDCTQSKESIVHNLLSILIKKNNQQVDDFLDFSKIILQSIFDKDLENFRRTMLESKSSFRMLFDGEDDAIRGKYHVLYYCLIGLFIMDNQWTSLFDFISTMLDYYLNIMTKAVTSKDDTFLPSPSIFFEKVCEISDSNDYLLPSQCVDILKMFPKTPKEFDGLVFKKLSNTRKKFDFWPFLSNLAYYTNPSEVVPYLEKIKMEDRSDYDHLLFLYNKLYSAKEECNGQIDDEQFLNSIQPDCNQVYVCFNDRETEFHDCVRAVVDLLARDDETISDNDKKKLFERIIHDLIGE